MVNCEIIINGCEDLFIFVLLFAIGVLFLVNCVGLILAVIGVFRSVLKQKAYSGLLLCVILLSMAFLTGGIGFAILFGG